MKPVLSLIKPLLLVSGDPGTHGDDLIAMADSDLMASDPAATTGISNRQLFLFVLTYVAYAAIYFARKPVSVVKSTLESELGLTRSMLSVVDTALLGFYMVGQFLTGSLVKVLGRSLPLTLGYAVCGVATVAMGFSSTATAMSVFWALSGFFQACVNPLLVIFVADLFPASMRASMVGLWQTSQQVGGIAANAFAGALLRVSGWRAVFISSGALVAAFSPILALVMLYAARTAPASGSAAAAPTKAKVAPTTKASGRSPLSVPGVTSIAVGYTLTKMSRYCLMFWAPYFLSNHVKMDASAAALMATIFDITGVLGSISSGLLCDRLLGGRMITAQLPFLAAAALSFGVWAAVCVAEKVAGQTYKSAHIAAMALVGFCVAAPDGVLGGAASRNLCEYAGSSDVALAAAASGLVNGCGSIGAILQGGLTAQLVDRVGWAGLYATLAVAMTATIVAVLPAVSVEVKAMRQESGVSKS